MNCRPLFVVLLWALCDFSVRINGANILGLMPVLSPSHHIWNSVLMHRLAELGHNVTILSVDVPKPNDKIPPNVTYIHMEKGYSIYKEGDAKVDINDFIKAGPFKGIKVFNDAIITLVDLLCSSKGLQTLLNYPDDFKFDLVIHDYSNGPVLLGFLHKFNYPPAIGVSAFHNPPITLDFMSNHYFPAYIPFHGTTFKTEMTFWERLENTLLIAYDMGYRRLVINPKIDTLVRKYFPKDMPYLDDIGRRTAIALVNSHPATNYVEPLPPNVIEVGGMQILDPKPLPKDLDEYMNKSTNGAVFFSFGTNMKSQDFTDEQVRTILNAMAELSQYNFMWKFDVKYLKEKIPKNVMVRSFYPQRDILAHPNLKAFVTHCGGLSSQEAIWRGVPMVGVPLFVDQHRNLRLSLEAGIAVKLDFATMTSKDIVEAIKKVIEDPKMRENIKVKSVQYRDRPMKPLDTAVWWVEYMLRNPNPYHLRSPAHKLNIFQANSLDCLLFILLVVILTFYFVVKLLAFAFRLLSKKNSKKIKVKKN
ncbi:UDP-glycosyltransferase UGT5-like [Eupeodes corollae]|uniref:UDP-glycosyltransferase UGT5-like n=1 Tax=Eupeodes corollae TaxID=290404 RepID=UPI0024919B28|nr:UDP-glycosyltransferase UGT5-like [Eupeodes corollae]